MNDPADQLKEAGAEAVRRDRISLFKQIDELTDELAEAVNLLPYLAGAAAHRKIQEIMDVLSDPLGEHMGNCELCDEPVFVQGRPDDDCCSAGEDGGWAHRSCMDALQTSNPELFRNTDAED